MLITVAKGVHEVVNLSKGQWLSMYRMSTLITFSGYIASRKAPLLALTVV